MLQTDNNKEIAMSLEKTRSLSTLAQFFYDVSLSQTDHRERARYQKLFMIALDIVWRIPLIKREVSIKEWEKARAMVYHTNEISSIGGAKRMLEIVRKAAAELSGS